MVVPASSALAAPGSISGQVTNGGQAVGSATVGYYDYATGAPVNGASADNGGSYTLSNVPPGDYKVCFQAQSYDNYAPACYLNANSSTEDFSLAAKVTVVSGQTTPNINGHLNTGGKIAGQITNAVTGAPVQYAQAVAYDSDGNPVTGAEADSSGDFSIQGLDTFAYTVCFGFSADQPQHLIYHSQCYNAKPFAPTSGDKVSVTEGQTTGGINAALIPHYLITVAHTGLGSVTSSPAGINCGSACSHDYDGGTLVALTPHPATGYHFTGWTGACTGTGACQFHVAAAATVGAKFVKTVVRPPRPTITDSSFNARRHKASFRFRGSGANKGFQCALVPPRRRHHKAPKPRFSRCRSPKSYKRLSSGKNTFEVRGVSDAGPGPAAKIGFSI